MRYRVVATVYVAAMLFAILGPWLVDDLSMILVEMGLNDGQGAALLDYIAALLLFVLATPFVFVLDFETPPRMLFALNGACWASALWTMRMAWRGIRRRTGDRPKS